MNCEIKIGILIKHKGLEVPINKTFDMLNEDPAILSNNPLKALVEVIETDNSYRTSGAICRLLEQGVWAIIAPQSIQLTSIIQSITSYYHIPVVLINWQPNSYYSDILTKLRAFNRQTGRDLVQSNNRNNQANKESTSVLDYTINLYPQADQLSRAYLDLIISKNWKSFSLIYDSSEDFIQVKDIFEMSFQDLDINVQKIRLPQEEGDIDEFARDHDDKTLEANTLNVAHTNLALENREESKLSSNIDYMEHCKYNANEQPNQVYAKLVKDLKKRSTVNLILSMPLDKACKILKEALANSLTTTYNDHIIANLDAHLLDLSGWPKIDANISAYTILDPEGQPIDIKPAKTWLGKRPVELEKSQLSTEYAMMSDAISLLAANLDDFVRISQNSADSSGRVIPISGPQMENGCDTSVAWEHGERFMNLLKESARSGGYTGDIQFDKFGQRVNFELNYVMRRNSSFEKVASWNFRDGMGYYKKHSDDYDLQAIKNKSLRVTVAKTEPYVMLKKGSQESDGNDRYEGYCIDLMNKLAKKLQFTYSIHEPKDGKYGKMNNNGSWDGMINELLVGDTDLAIVDLTITKERQSAVDFTHPFMTLGIAILYKKPKLEEAEMYSFFLPFSTEVWLSMGSAYLGISLAIWIISRMSPVEWKNPHPCVDTIDEKDKENEIHSIGAGLWFTIGSLMQQGSDLAPRSASVRSLASVWYFFTLILISSYTANFAAFLTASRMQSPIESAEDLSKQIKIDYGAKSGGATQSFFATSNHTTYRRMWNFMESKKFQGVFPDTNDKGISMVKKGNFAFLMESTTIEYLVQRDCDLTQIGGLLDHKGYGIALRKRSPYRAALSKSIVELNEAGELHELKSKWWVPEKQACSDEKESVLATSELGIDKVGGVFVMLLIGLGAAAFAAILEYVWKYVYTSKGERGHIWSMLWDEIKRICKCGSSKRPNPASSHYNKSQTSQPSSTNLNASTNSLNKANGIYVTRLPNNVDISIPNVNHNQTNQASGGYEGSRGSGLYGNMPVDYDNRTRRLVEIPLENFDNNEMIGPDQPIYHSNKDPDIL